QQLLPSRRQIYGWLLLAALLLIIRILAALSPALAPTADTLALSLCALAGLLVAWDAVSLLRLPSLSIERQCSTVLPVNRWSQVHLAINHACAKPTPVQILDGLGAGLVSDQQPCQAALLPQQITRLTYRLKALRRGAFQLQQVFYRIPSPCGLWLRQGAIRLEEQLKVFPDFSAISAFKLLAREQQTNLLGIKKRRRRGEGADFAQLREYRPGDALRNIHWKATALRQQLISKEYQDAKDQRLIVLLDTGQRMRAQEETLSHFDAALNAAILLGFIALHQGDHFGLQTFGPTERWVPLQKGTDKVQTLLNSLYDLDAQPEAADFFRAVELISQRHLKRSLVVILTNLRSEDQQELTQAVKQLSKKHLVLIGDLQESELQQAAAKPIANLDDALLYTALQQFAREHEQSLNQLKAQGVMLTSVEPKYLAATLANYYLSVKRSGIL
ncbi:MAG TPA: DUF58 domain-containing protein, partial [Cellvibrionaceae bacterium]|nr:DUF58 domain-containing protein [Cellvibrionaceae bacterium]